MYAFFEFKIKVSFTLYSVMEAVGLGNFKYLRFVYPMDPNALRTCAVGSSCHVLTDLK